MVALRKVSEWIHTSEIAFLYNKFWEKKLFTLKSFLFIKKVYAQNEREYANGLKRILHTHKHYSNVSSVFILLTKAAPLADVCIYTYVVCVCLVVVIVYLGKWERKFSIFFFILWIFQLNKFSFYKYKF